MIKSIQANRDNTVKIRTSDGIMACCFVVLKVQKQWFEAFGSLIHVDATYKINYENFPHTRPTSARDPGRLRFDAQRKLETQTRQTKHWNTPTCQCRTRKSNACEQ